MKAALKPGEQFSEYTIVRRIGKGGQGSVYEAEDPFGVRWALKVTDELELSPAAEERFRREAQCVTTRLQDHLLRSSGVLVGDHYGVWQRRFYVKMKLLHGRSLAEVLQAEGRLTISDAVKTAKQIATALQQAHAAGVVHRDLKPENVFITTEGATFVLDWGCLQVLEMGRSSTTAHSGPICTPGYAALEQFRGADEATRPTVDIYALGVVLYELLAGHHPFLGWSRAIDEQFAPAAPNPSENDTAPGLPSFASAPMKGCSSTVPSPGVRGVAISGPGQTAKLNSFPPMPGVSIDENLPETRTQRSGEQAVPVRRKARKFSLAQVIAFQEKTSPNPIPGIPSELWFLVESMLAKRPEDRPQSAARVIAALDALEPRVTRQPKRRSQADAAGTVAYLNRKLAALERAKRYRTAAVRAALGVAAAGYALYFGLSTQNLDTQSHASEAHLSALALSPVSSGVPVTPAAPSVPPSVAAVSKAAAVPVAPLPHAAPGAPSPQAAPVVPVVEAAEGAAPKAARVAPRRVTATRASSGASARSPEAPRASEAPRPKGMPGLPAGLTDPELVIPDWSTPAPKRAPREAKPAILPPESRRRWVE